MEKITRPAMGSARCVKTTDRGRILVVKSVVHRGELLITEEPYVYILNNNKRGVFCDTCLSASSSLQRCSGCKFVRYCCRSCQKEDWSRSHKIECGHLKKVSPKTPPDLARLLALALWKQDDQRSEDTEAQADQHCFPTTLDQLESHHEKLSATRIEHFQSLLCVLQQYVGQDGLPGAGTVLRMFGAAVCNSFSICDDDLNGCGVGIYMTASMLNHSCDPNCVVVFTGRRLQVRAVKDLGEGEECTISYVDTLLPRGERQAELQERYHFGCHCQKCQDESTAIQHGDGSSEHHLHGIKQILKEVEEAKKLQDWQRAITLSETCLQSQSAVSLPPHHHLLVKLRDGALDACIEAQSWEEAASYGQQNVEPYRFHYGAYHPSLGVHLLRVGKLKLYLEKASEAAKYLREAQTVLEVTHGNNHPLMATLRELLSSCR